MMNVLLVGCCIFVWKKVLPECIFILKPLLNVDVFSINQQKNVSKSGLNVCRDNKNAYICHVN